MIGARRAAEVRDFVRGVAGEVVDGYHLAKVLYDGVVPSMRLIGSRIYVFPFEQDTVELDVPLRSADGFEFPVTHGVVGENFMQDLSPSYLRDAKRAGVKISYKILYALLALRSMMQKIQGYGWNTRATFGQLLAGELVEFAGFRRMSNQELFDVLRATHLLKITDKDFMDVLITIVVTILQERYNGDDAAFTKEFRDQALFPWMDVSVIMKRIEWVRARLERPKDQETQTEEELAVGTGTDN